MVDTLKEPGRTERFLREIHDISVAVRSGFKDEVDLLLSLGCREFGLEAAVVSSHHEENRLTILYTAGSENFKPGAVFDLCDTFCGQVIVSGHPLAISDAAGSEWRDHPACAKLGLRAYLGAPIAVHGGKPGTVCFVSWRPRVTDFDTTELEMFHILAQRIESALMRLEVADALSESEARFRATFEHANVGIAHVGIDGTWLRVNPRLCEILGYGADELRRMTFQDLTYEDDLDLNLDKLRRALDGDIDNYSIQKRYVRKDGDMVHAHLTVRLLRDAHGEPKHFISVIEDVTIQKRLEEARRRLEDRVQEAQKLESLGVLAGGIAHDFNNLLTAILGNASLAGEMVPQGTPLHKTLQQIERAASRAGDLTNQLLAYAGKGQLVVETVDVAEIVDDMRDLMHSAVSKTVRPVWNRPSEPMYTTGDATQLRQIVLNLMTNASEALESEAGTVELSVLPWTVSEPVEDSSWTIAPAVGSYIAIRVRDEGSGMDEETRRRLFEPFFTRKFIGRGLGLSAVLGIVRAHRGAIHVQSEPGAGTTVTVLLPAAEVGEARDESHQEATETWHGAGSILVVDDEPHVREVACTILRRLGFEPTIAHDGQAAVDAVRVDDSEFRAVLLDMTMPRLSGPEAFRQIHELRPELPVVLMSGFNEQHVAAALEGAGVSGFLKKPFKSQQLLDRLRDALGGTND